jgi:hypothetical protein
MLYNEQIYKEKIVDIFKYQEHEKREENFFKDLRNLEYYLDWEFEFIGWAQMQSCYYLIAKRISSLHYFIQEAEKIIEKK